MSQCPTIHLQFAKVPKTLAKHINTKLFFKISFATGMFTLTNYCVDMKTEFPFGIFEMMMLVK